MGERTKVKDDMIHPHPRLLHVKTEQEEDTAEKEKLTGKWRAMETERETDRGIAIEKQSCLVERRVIKVRTETVTPCLLLDVHLMLMEGKKNEIVNLRSSEKNSETKTEDERRR